jgi:hypothetical protein
MKESWKEFSDKWVKICLSTEPADRPRAEAAIRGIYKELRYDPPARIEWASSPREGRIMRAAYAVRVAESDEWKGYDDLLRSSSLSWHCLPGRIQKSSVGITLLSMSGLETVLTALKHFAFDFGGRLFDRIWIGRYVPELDGIPSPSQLAHRPAVLEVGLHFTAYLKAYLETHGAMAIGTLLRAGTEHSTLDDAEQVLAILGGDEWLSRSKFTERDKALEYLREIVRDMFWELPFDGTVTYQHVEHAAVYNYCRLNGLCDTYPLNEHLVALFESAAGATAGPTVCWLYERPASIAVDERGRLHRNDGPAITYRDGQSVWAYHRIELWEDAIMRPETITFDTIPECRNIERRRALIELFGLERFVREMQARGYRSRKDENGTLWKLDDDIALVEVVNGTPEPDGSYKHYFLPCDPRAETATEAVAGTYGLRPEQYRVAKRT